MLYRDQYIANSDSITNQVVVPIDQSTLLQLCRYEAYKQSGQMCSLSTLGLSCSLYFLVGWEE